MSQSVTITPSELPSLPLDERRDLPNTAGIYFAMAGDTVLYIGQSTSLRQRWAVHHRLKQLNGYGRCHIAWMTVEDVTLLDELEHACIAHFAPALNGNAVPGGAHIARAGETWTAVRLPEAARNRLDEMAREQERSVSFVLRKLVLDALEREAVQRGEQS